MNDQHARASGSPESAPALTTDTLPGSSQRHRTQPRTVAIVGLGYVGLPLAVIARRRGHTVYGIDIDDRRRATIASAAVPDLEPSFVEALKKQPLDAAGTFEKVADADIVVICVPTPVDHDRQPDLGPVIGAAESVGTYLRKGQLVILESTVHPSTCEEIVIPILEKRSGLIAGTDFDVAHCPERINPGDAFWTVQDIPRVVGGLNRRSLRRAAAFYRSVLDALVYEMASIREAEAVKMVENSFRDINIAFVNELAMSFSTLGIDVVHVIEGASTKPFGFMPHFPGCGVGGHCIPVDPYYLIRYAKEHGFDHELLALARSVNERMPAFTVNLATEALRTNGIPIEGATVAVLGLSYKANISDLRESPSFEIVEELEGRGASVRTFDPYALERSSVQSLADALDGAHAAIIATAHADFAKLPPRTFASRGIGVVIDGRNCLPKEAYLAAGLAYRGIGR
ncbi:MAG TPA: nucleotide sugar dehydrogenase [Candidatus Paceibacterota bacterium]|nr:nucleotide sugar dehydrogenase [Candidatus Paceibacterota bacterium]